MTSVDEATSLLQIQFQPERNRGDRRKIKELPADIGKVAREINFPLYGM
jgi:hypothetical protein